MTGIKSWKGILKWGGLAALFLFTLLVGWTAFRAADFIHDITQKEGSTRLGRELVIEGPLTIKWRWLTPYIHAEQVKLANAPGFKEPYMLEIGTLDFDIAIWKLLYGRTELSTLTIDNLHLVLDKNKDTQANWDLPFFSSSQTASEQIIPDNRYNFPVIGTLKITNSSIIYRDIPKALDLQLTLDTAQSESGDEQQLKLTGTGTLQKQTFKIEAIGGSIDNLRDTSREYPLDLDIQMGPTKVALKGTFADPVKMTGINATLNLNGNSMADLFYLTAIPLPPTPPYHLAGSLKKEGDIWSYNDFSGKVGDSDLAGHLAYNTGGDRGYLTAELNSKTTDIDDLGGFIGMAPDPGETAAPEQERQAAKEAASPKLFPDVPINLERLRASDLDVKLNVEKLNAPGLPFNGLKVRFLLEQGLLKMDPMFLSLANGIAEGNLTLDGRKDIPNVKTNLDLKKLRLSRFFEGTPFAEESKGYIGGHIELAGQGKSLADVMGGSDGRIVMVMDGGRISLLLVEAADIDIAEATPLFLGEDKSTQIYCGVADFKVTDGILYSQLFVLDTSDTNLQGRVDIDLLKETIDAQLDAESKDSSLLALQSPIIISGRLKDPSIGLEPVESGIRAAGAAVLGAVLTPFAAVIPFIEVGVGKDSNCKALIARAEKSAGKPIEDKPR